METMNLIIKVLLIIVLSPVALLIVGSIIFIIYRALDFAIVQCRIELPYIISNIKASIKELIIGE